MRPLPGLWGSWKNLKACILWSIVTPENHAFSASEKYVWKLGSCLSYYFQSFKVSGYVVDQCLKPNNLVDHLIIFGSNFRKVRGNERHFISCNLFLLSLSIRETPSHNSTFSFYLEKSTSNVHCISVNELLKTGLKRNFQNLFRMGRRMALLTFTLKKQTNEKEKQVCDLVFIREIWCNECPGLG